MADHMEEAHAIVRKQLGKAAQIRKKRYDLRVKPKKFAIGTFVWYYTPRKYVGKSPKWQKFYTGPFLVVGCVSPLNYVIQKSKRSTKFVAHVDKLKPCYDDTLIPWLTGDGVAVVDAPHSVSPDVTAESNNRLSEDGEEIREGSSVENRRERPKRIIRKPIRFDRQ